MARRESSYPERICAGHLYFRTLVRRGEHARIDMLRFRCERAFVGMSGAESRHGEQVLARMAGCASSSCPSRASKAARRKLATDNFCCLSRPRRSRPGPHVRRGFMRTAGLPCPTRPATAVAKTASSRLNLSKSALRCHGDTLSLSKLILCCARIELPHLRRRYNAWKDPTFAQAK